MQWKMDLIVKDDLVLNDFIVLNIMSFAGYECYI